MPREPRNIPDRSVLPLTSVDIPWRRKDWPIDWHDTFGRRAPIALEIGFGDGTFLLDLARRRPEMDHIGIEISWGRMRIVAETATTEGLSNLRTLHGDAEIAVEKLFAPGTLSEVWINFPDPWQKLRHHRRRLVDHAFLIRLSECMVDGGHLEIATDHAELAEWVASVLDTQQDFVVTDVGARVHERPGRRPTKYEMKARDVGRRIHYFVRKNAGARQIAPREEPVPPMATIRLHGEADIELALREIDSRTIREKPLDDELLLVFHRAYRSFEARRYLVDCLIQEGDLEQAIAIAVDYHDDGNVVIRPAATGFPRPTAGVKRATWWIARWILDACPTLDVSSSEMQSTFPLEKR